MNEWKASPYSEYDRYLFHQGTHYRSYQMLGAHITTENGQKGVRFAVWAPHASGVRVVGDFNEWNGQHHKMHRLPESAIWVLFIPGLDSGEVYKYEVCSPYGESFLKADPYAFYAEVKPQTASRVFDLHGYKWQDGEWQEQRQTESSFKKPMSIYECHLGSWKTPGFEQYLTYKELADQLVSHVADMGFTHIELMPIVEHPFDGSWGYQGTGYYAATSRYGSPHEFMYFVDQCHKKGIGVILDWVPGHFCRDAHGLRMFDGTPCFEYADERRADNQGWGTSNFDLGKTEVQSFLISNALFWMEIFHVDGIRVDAVASMLYLDYCKEDGGWNPNSHGGRENLESIAFLRKLSEVIFGHFPNALMMAEESTSWPLVTMPTYLGGLGFNYKWNMGWMNDMLEYVETDPIHRKYHHNLLTFSFMYAFSENFVLPLSHDEVVHGKRSLLDKMPGDYWQKFANLRAFYGYMMAHPGKKLLFMGGEYGQFIEWNYKESLDWHLLEYDMHGKMQDYVKALQHFYKEEKCLWELDHDWQGFEWIDANDNAQSVVSFMRKADDGEFVIAISNFTPVVRENYRIGVPVYGVYEEIFNSDCRKFGGSGQENRKDIVGSSEPWHSQKHSVEVLLPPLGTIFLRLKEKLSVKK